MNYLTQLHLVGHFCILYGDARKHEYQAMAILYKKAVSVLWFAESLVAGYSVFLQNCEYGCELLTCKST